METGNLDQNRLGFVLFWQMFFLLRPAMASYLRYRIEGGTGMLFLLPRKLLFLPKVTTTEEGPK